MQKTLAALVFGVVVASLSLVPALAGESPRPENPVARVNVGPTSVDWSPAVDYERLVLTVVGPQGFENRQELEAGQSPSLTLFKPNGERLADGVYRYELRLLPRTVAGTKNLTDKTVQTGGLWIRDGAFVTPTPGKNPVASPPSSKRPQIRNITEKDSVVSDDLVVQGTACIGPDCVNGDPDATNTLKLKSRLPRILFDDPFSGFFPARDWALQGNTADPADYFILQDVTSATIPFSIHGGSPNDTLVVASGGFDAQERRVGIGVSVPLKNLHVVNAATPTIRLEQPVSPGPARVWDVGASNTQFFVSDITASSSVPFKILAGAPSDSLVVAGDGRVGIGTASPSLTRLDVRANAASQTVARFQNSSATGYSGAEYLNQAGSVISFFGVDNAASTTRLNSINSYPIVILTNSTERMRITSGGNVGIGTASPTHPLEMASGAFVTTGGVWTNASSRELKRDIHSLGAEEALSALAGLDPVRFYYKADPSDEYLGFIAEDVPDLVATADRKTLSPMDL
ncbi:MAG TPA: tail fiber domain-containing protein, partial [Thermoanaerobaculia bacterium]|nr:tail fiber domain-containing protein [Thermoanaerobaculia bacterium]